jgi:hypothetical protein
MKVLGCMKSFRNKCLTSLFAFTIAISAGSAAWADDASSLRGYFKVEGDDAIANVRNGTLSFSATRSQFQSGHGHGWRNEAKIREGLRFPVGETKEHFSATVTPNLPPWAKTIVAQYHFEGLKTAMKVYVQDTKGGGGLDGKEGNGVFDILARITGQDGKENAYPLGTVQSGEPFDLDVSFNGGVVNVAVSTKKWGRKETGDVTLPDTESVVYFKFGDYLQAASTPGQYTTNENDWKAYYAAHHIDNTDVDFSHVHFSRG